MVEYQQTWRDRDAAIRRIVSMETIAMAQLPDVPRINVAALQAWLTSRTPVTILDVRPIADRIEWAIPDSLHIDAYDALWADDPSALSDVTLPRGVPVVTVCNAGQTSRLAARRLIERGFDARSLDGGMTAWSLAWNTANVPLANSSVQVTQVRRTGKGCLSYLVGSGDEAIVIDPSLPPEVYAEFATERGWRITHVLDTHVHADHLSRAKALADRSGATLILPPQQRVAFPFTPLPDSAMIALGSSRITALHTPGHTHESACYLLDNRALFTGDTIFPTTVGRPDLLADDSGAQERAALLYDSVARLLALDPHIQMLPCHTSQPIPFDGRPIAATIGDVRERLRQHLASKDRFVAETLAHLPPTPANHRRIVAHNEAGTLPEDVTELEAGANRCAVVMNNEQ